MIRAEQTLHEILSMGVAEESQEVLMFKARALIEKYKVASAVHHQALTPHDERRAHLALDLEKLRDVVDREIDRRCDRDLADHLCDLLEQLSDYLHAETG
jgi:hypothetical protein